MGLLVLLMIAGVAVWGINDILIGSQNKTVAKVGNSKITAFELDNIVQNNKMQLMQSGMSSFSEELTTVLRNNALVNLVGDRLLQNELNNLNIQLDAKEVLKQDYLSQSDFSKDKLKAIAHSMGGEEAFLSKISKEKKIDFVQGSLTAQTPVSDGLVKGIYDFENQTRNIEYIEIGTENIADAANPSDKELQDFYEKNKDSFISPEYRGISYIILDKTLVKQGKDVAEKLHDISNQILDKVAGGATLEEVAKEYGLSINKMNLMDTNGKLEDGSNAPAFPKVKDFLAAVFATEQGEISDLLESDNGDVYSFIRTDEIKEKRIKTLDEVKPLALVGLKTQLRAQKLVELAKKLKEDLDSNKTTLSDFAAKNGVTVKQKSDIGIKNRDFSNEFVTDIFNQKIGGYSNINRAANSKLIIAKVTGVNPGKPSEALGLFEYKTKIQEQISQELMAEYLDYLRQKYNVNVYSK